MKKYLVLLMNDFRHAGTDPVLIVGFLGPLILIILTRFGFPMTAHWLETSYSFDLNPYRDFTSALFIVTIPMLLGMMTGLLMLDERDENIISYFAVTPLMRKGYLVYRLILPIVISAIWSVMFLLYSGLIEFHIEYLLMLVLLVIEAPCFAMLVAAFSANKVEGLALYKIGAIVFIAGPIVIFFVPDVWQWVAVWIPTFWPTKIFLEGSKGETFAAIYNFIIGFMVHIALLLMIIRLFIRRAD
ncbi:ABC transporter permease [Paenibacillus camelliae]|uniref:ABC transporter permease n=1 Tax=Paenibacillus camelliae TaxID=512410 RepID=UPI002041FA40|nr:ABC transporter permease [Paenibacillus camelliae]MCM3631865.1 ABC transporter permease [Paenibacillus camelliae]